MTETYEVAENIYLIDAEAAFEPKVTSVYLVDEEVKVLIETGSPAAKDTVVKELRKLGVNPSDISYILVTHIHLDHSGATGALLKEMPQARVLVHPRGSKHLIEPGKLINSTREVQGETVLKRYGLVVPADPVKIQTVEDNQVVPLGRGQKLRIMFLPGHAPHHLCVYEDKNKGVFTGDIAGLYIQELETTLPNSMPPSFDLELNIQSIEKILSLSPEILYFSHFGTTRKVSNCLNFARQQLRDWAEVISKVVDAYPNHDEAVEKLHDFINREGEPFKQVIPDFYDRVLQPHMCLCVRGFIDYFSKKKASSNQ